MDSRKKRNPSREDASVEAMDEGSEQPGETEPKVSWESRSPLPVRQTNSELRHEHAKKHYLQVRYTWRKTSKEDRQAYEVL